MKLTRYDIQKLHEVEALIKENIREHYSIDELARKAWMNRDKLKKGFKQLFGITPHQCLVKTRMEMAKALMEGTDKPLKEIASDTGYSYTSFITKFSSYYGCTPAVFKNKL